MSNNPSTPLETNLAMLPGARLIASVMNPTGGGARHPAILLNETAHQLDGKPLREYDQACTYDTFHGRTEHNDLDWYAIHLPCACEFNCVEMTMGLPFRDGGWWTSLNVEAQASPESEWRPAKQLRITPPYNFADSRAGRRPFETYQLFFDDVEACAIRVIGVPGGLVRFTSLARLAVYHRDLSRWNASSFVHSPTPQIFRLIAPTNVWDLSEGLVKATGVTVAIPQMDYYLDDERLERSWEREAAQYTGQPRLILLLGDTMGWDVWDKLPVETHHFKTNLHPRPWLELVCDGQVVAAVAPVVVEDQVVAQMLGGQALLMDRFDLNWHRAFANQHQIPWETYQAAMDRTPQVTLGQMEGIAEVLAVLANTIADLAHRNHLLEGQLHRVQSNPSQRELIQRAAQFIQVHLEDEIGVADAAREVGLNPAYFSTVFKSQMGCTPVEYLARLRIERAKEYLRHTTMSVMDVCVALDYTPSYFQRLFKRMVGITPGEFIRQERHLP